jgi:7,8-dihydropterin-6-yl-methyl-4-(beta-D-ribofuranosyl)aminobenzene 5'-phosphate synthase
VSLLLLNNEVVQAETLRSAPAEIDYLSVRVVTDSYQIAVSPHSKAGSVEIKRFGFAVGPYPPERALLSEFGLSLFASSQRGAESRNVLVDFGYTPLTLLNNLELLGIDVASVHALVLSHGHYDHFGGLVGFFSVHPRAN